MSSLEKNANMLRDFGLTANQAKVYLAIIHLGIAQVGKISRASKVRREDVYRIMPKLEKMGLVERTLTSPIKIRGKPLEEALSILINREKTITDRKISTLEAKKVKLLEDFRANRSKLKLEGDEANFVLLPTRDTVINKAVAILEKAEKEIDVITSTEEFARFLPILAEPIETLLKKLGKVHIILELKEYNELLLKNIRNHLSPTAFSSIKFVYQPLNHYIIVDYSQVLMATSPDSPLGERPHLWTNNKSFVALMQENFEQYWHSGVNSKNIQTIAISDKAKHIVEAMKPTDHAILLYQTEEAKYDVLFNYIRIGLDNDEACAYVASAVSPNEIRDAMKKVGINVEKYEETGALKILGYNEIYIIQDKFDIPTTLGLWNKLYNEAMAKRFKGFRVTGEMTCFFEHNLLRELIEYETALHKVLETPMIAICAYNSEDLNKAFNPLNLYNELVKAHGTVIFAGLDNKLGKIEIRKV